MIIVASEKFKNFISIISLSNVLLGLSVMVGWFFNITILKSVLPNYSSMKFNTAMCIVLVSTSLYVKIKNRNRRWYRVSNALSVFVLLICALSFSQDPLNYSVGIDQLFVNEVQQALGPDLYPGRMSQATAICFCLMSIALLGVESAKRYSLIFSQGLLHVVALIAFISILGYLLDVPKFYKLAFMTSMAVHASFSFFLLAIAASLINPTLGITGLLTGNGIGNMMARRLILQMLIVIPFLGFIRVLAHRHALVSVEFGIALLTVSFFLISLLLIWRTSNQLNRIDLEKKQAEERFRLVVEYAPNAMILVNKEGYMILANNQTEKLFGYKRNELIGSKLEILVPPTSRKNHPDLRNTFFESPSARSMGSGRELYAARKDGTEFPVEIGLNPIETDDGTVVLASVIDITERKRNEGMIQLELKNKELEQFNYIASHDLQEPLRTVSNYVQILEEDYFKELNDEARKYLQTIKNAALRMSMLVRSLLNFSRVGQNKKLVLTDCNQIVNNIIADLNNLIQTAKADVVVNTLPTINAYETELLQLFQNLINNAIKFRKDGVTPIIEIGHTRYDGSFEFYVKDNGIGIEAKYFDRIFQIFQKLNTSLEFDGYGMGLANCKKIAEMHGGKIWVESDLNQGSTFKFTISNYAS